MHAPSESQFSACREVTAAETEHYQEYGWVKLTGFVRPELVRALLRTARERMGDDGDGNAPYGRNINYFNAERGGGLTVSSMRTYIEEVGRNAKVLMGRESGVGVRYLLDFFAPKLPSSKKTRNAGNGPTDFHQDFPNYAVDRSGGMNFWVALENYGPEFGTMSFVNRSHRRGVVGNYRTFTQETDLFTVYPEFRKLGLSEPMTYAAGDVTVHSHLTSHGAAANLTDRPRWAYVVVVQPADIHWTGAPPEAYDTTGWRPFQTFDDARFPIIG
jgi:hypothetical protein